MKLTTASQIYPQSEADSDNDRHSRIALYFTNNKDCFYSGSFMLFSAHDLGDVTKNLPNTFIFS